MRRALEIIARHLVFNCCWKTIQRGERWVGRQVENRFMVCKGWAGSTTGNEKGFNCEGQWIGKAMQGIIVL